ncbi:hypothetical protein BK004_02150 [bacterium CG10_46_32]|nr:MAG: hypothetical protein BK004_02150 [bacterium CG10_46_32]PIR56232.1 MAG: hypothetical protein COU73_02175 [Parcubacteria group bacterium CG10_big_fil_rev_8_21_14_0_10_46_32]
MGKVIFNGSYQYIISVDNLLLAWQEFIRGKRNRRDVQEFERDLMTNVFALHRDLANKTYQHAPYYAFNISDPKPRNIHKASVRDRLLHHALYRVLYPFFDKTFIADSYSCRLGKGTHRAMNRFRAFARKASRNHTRTVWVLKCDIRKFFASIDQNILIEIIKGYLPDRDIRWLISQIVSSFHSTKKGAGLPLGNLTSQLLVNVYMNKFDRFVKHKLKAKYYIRYADDFVMLSHDKERLRNQLLRISEFLEHELNLALHPDKVFIKTLSSGVDFLGWVHFPDHCVLRTASKRRMLMRLGSQEARDASVQSYVGLLQHGNAFGLTQAVNTMSRRTNTFGCLAV